MVELLSTAPAADIRSDALRNRDRILEVAKAKLRAGEASLRMNDIAKEAGVGVGTMYRHFPTTQSLLEAAAASGFDELVGIAADAAQIENAAGALRHLIGRSWECLERRPELARVLESQEIACLETMQMLTGFAGAVDMVLTRARRARLIRRGIKNDDLRRLLLAMLHARNLTGDPPARRDVYLAVLLDGLKHPAGRSRSHQDSAEMASKFALRKDSPASD